MPPSYLEKKSEKYRDLCMCKAASCESATVKGWRRARKDREGYRKPKGIRGDEELPPMRCEVRQGSARKQKPPTSQGWQREL